MSFDLQRILESKRALRRNLASRPLTEKLRTLDRLRERTIDIRRTARQSAPGSGVLQNDAARYFENPEYKSE